MSFFTTPDQFNIHYETFAGLLPQTTLFIHGNLASNRWWLPTTEVLQKKNNGAKLAGDMICAEFRGCGKSTAPKSESDVSMDKFANDFIGLVKSLKLTMKINLVGHSTGGLIVALMLAKAPELFNKAFLLDPVGADGVTFDTAMIAAFEAMKADKNLTATVIGSTIHNNNADSAYFKNILVEDAFTGVKAVGHLVLKALDGLDSKPLVKTITHPVKVVHGEFDVLLPKADSEKLASLMQHGVFATLPGCGHCGNVEKPELFVETFTQFLFN